MKTYFFEKSTKLINIELNGPKDNKEKTEIIKSRNKVGDISTDLKKIKGTIRVYMNNCKSIR